MGKTKENFSLSYSNGTAAADMQQHLCFSESHMKYFLYHENKGKFKIIEEQSPEHKDRMGEEYVV